MTRAVRNGPLPRLAACLAAMAALWAPSALAQVVPDGTTSAGSTTPIAGPNYAITSSTGVLAGTNLHHSFGTFNVGTGQHAVWSSSGTDSSGAAVSAGSITNVINRVTGGSPSTIDGEINSLAYPNADFYFINPQGVTFNANASVNVPAGFHVSTADELKFANGDTLKSTLGPGSTFSVAAPEAFGFLGSSAAPISFSSANVSVVSQEQLSVVGGNIAVSNAAPTVRGLYAPGGNILIVAAAGPGTVPLSPQLAPTLGGFADIDILGVGTSRVDVLVSSFNQPTIGEVHAWANDIRIDQGTIGAHSLGTASSGVVALTATGDLVLRNSGFVEGRAMGSGHGADVIITADNVFVGQLGIPNWSGVRSTSEGLGDGGDIRIEATGLEIYSGSMIDTGVFSSGNSGDIHITLTDHLLADGTGVFTGIFAQVNANANIGSGGDITVEAPVISLANNARISVVTFGDGSAGNIHVMADDLALAGGHIQADTLAGGDSGSISINVTGLLSLNPGGSISAGTSVGTAGNGGSIAISAKNLSSISGIISTGTYGIGRAGDLEITAEWIRLNHSTLTSETFGTGSAGTLTITSDDLILDNSNIIVDTFSTGNAGIVNLTAHTIEVTNGGQINSNTSAAGRGGIITICCPDTFTVDGLGSALLAGTAPGSTGDAGGIGLATSHLILSNGGAVTVASAGTGQGGRIGIKAKEFDIQGGASDSGISTVVTGAAGGSSSSAGEIKILAGKFTAEDGSFITTDSSGGASAGSIIMRIGQGVVRGANSNISSTATSSNLNDAGRIEIGAVNFTIDNSSLTTNSQSGSGGQIVLDIDKRLTLLNGQITTSVEGSTTASDAGNISIGKEQLTDVTLDSDICLPPCQAFDPFGDFPGPVASNLSPPQFFINQGGIIQANANIGSGGQVEVAAGFLINNGEIEGVTEATSASGLEGQVTQQGATVTPPPIVIIPDDKFQSPCAASAVGRKSSLTEGGSRETRRDPTQVGPAYYMTTNTDETESSGSPGGGGAPRLRGTLTQASLQGSSAGSHGCQ